MPPRALWVPFELGRPFGAPDDAGSQKRVLLGALDLLEAEEGPILADFPDDAPSAGDITGWANALPGQLRQARAKGREAANDDG